jgi:Acyl-CoA dehydrogenase, C-terminal domain
MHTFARSRPGIGSMAVGISQRALDESVKYAKERTQFGQPIASFQAIQFMLADMAIDIEAMRLLCYKAAWMVDQGVPTSIVSSYAEAFSADRGMQIATDAVQIFGGYGYMHEGIPGGEASARRKAPPDLRRHEPDPACRDRAASSPRVDLRRSRPVCRLGQCLPVASLQVDEYACAGHFKDGYGRPELKNTWSLSEKPPAGLHFQ